MNKYNGKYFKFGDGIIRIKETHSQTNRAATLVEIDDYCGNIWGSLMNYWTLNNNSIVTEFTDLNICSFSEVTIKDFRDLLIKEINNSIDEIKQGTSYCVTNWKKTDIRINILRKYYGTKP